MTGYVRRRIFLFNAHTSQSDRFLLQNSLLCDPSHNTNGDATWPTSSTDPSLTLTEAQKSGWLFFRNFSHAYLPHADDLVRYLHSWASYGCNAGQLRQRSLNVRYNVAVIKVTRLSESPQGKRLGPRFRLSLSDGTTLLCTFLVVATGLQVRMRCSCQAFEHRPIVLICNLDTKRCIYFFAGSSRAAWRQRCRSYCPWFTSYLRKRFN